MLPNDPAAVLDFPSVEEALSRVENNLRSGLFSNCISHANALQSHLTTSTFLARVLMLRALCENATGAAQLAVLSYHAAVTADRTLKVRRSCSRGHSTLNTVCVVFFSLACIICSPLGTT